MAFDASVIGSIGDSMPTGVGIAQQKMTLKDLANKQELSSLNLAQQKRQASDQEKINSILKDQDLSNSEGISKASSALGRAGYSSQAMQLLQLGQKIQSGEIENQRNQMEMYALQQDYVAGEIDGVLASADAARQAGKTDAEVQAIIMNGIVQAKGRLERQTLPNGSPILTQDMLQKLGDGPMTYDRLKSIEMSSRQGRALIAQRLDEYRALTQRMSESEKSRHDMRMEEIAATNAGTRKEAQDQKAAGSFTPEESDLMAALTEKGVSVPTGFRSKEQQKATFSALIRNNPGKSANEIADGIKSGQLSFGAEKKETTTAAGIAGKIRYAEEEINQLAPMVMQASAQVPRGRFVPWNKLKQMGESSISDPKLKQLKSYLTTLSNAYDMLAARGGTDMEKRKHNREMLDSADSPEALKAAVDAIMMEAKVSDVAASKSMVPRAGEQQGSASNNDPLGIR